MATREAVMRQILDKMSVLLSGDWHPGWTPAEAVEELAEAYAELAGVEAEFLDELDDFELDDDLDDD